MAKRPTLVLFGYALFLVICGLSPLFVLGLDAAQHIHGLRLAVAVGLCGLFASRFKRSPALAILAIDSAGILLLCTSVNYARLANNWYGLAGMDRYSTYLVGTMAIGGLLAFWLLMITRPKCRANCSEWWRPTPLITIPSLLILPFTRRRHGLGITRRIGLAMGILFLIVGFVFSMSSRFPQVSIAQLAKLGQFAQKNNELLKLAMTEPDLVMKIIRDPGNTRNILDDPRAQELIEELSEEGGLLHGVDKQAMVDSIASGDFESLNEILAESDLPNANELLALAVEEDSPIGEFIGEEGTAAAKAFSEKLAEDNKTLEEFLLEDDGKAASKLISSMTNPKIDDSVSPDIDELMLRLLRSVDPEKLNSVQSAGHIDFSDASVRATMRKINMDPQLAAKFAALDPAYKGAALKLISESSSNSPGSIRTNTKIGSYKLSTHITRARIDSKLSAERDISELSNRQTRLTFSPVASPRKALQQEPIYIQDIVKPQQDFITKRLSKVQHNKSVESKTNEISTELAYEDAAENYQETPNQEIFNAIETLEANSVTKYIVIDDAKYYDIKPVNEDLPGKTQKMVIDSASDIVDNITHQLTIPLDNPRSIIGFLCVIVGLVAVSAALARR